MSGLPASPLALSPGFELKVGQTRDLSGRMQTARTPRESYLSGQKTKKSELCELDKKVNSGAGRRGPWAASCGLCFLLQPCPRPAQV